MPVTRKAALSLMIVSVALLTAACLGTERKYVLHFGKNLQAAIHERTAVSVNGGDHTGHKPAVIMIKFTPASANPHGNQILEKLDNVRCSIGEISFQGDDGKFVPIPKKEWEEKNNLIEIQHCI